MNNLPKKKKSNSKPSGYMSFIKEYERKKKVEGKYFKDINAVQAEASPLWNKMSPAQKAEYGKKLISINGIEYLKVKLNFQTLKLKDGQKTLLLLNILPMELVLMKLKDKRLNRKNKSKIC